MLALNSAVVFAVLLCCSNVTAAAFPVWHECEGDHRMMQQSQK